MTAFNLPSGQSKIQEILSLAGGLALADDSAALSYEQRRALRHICQCRTSESGFNLEVCDSCGYQHLHYNSCGDRNCPICEALKKEIWVDQRSSEVIDCAYYHAVFTCPHELNPLFLAGLEKAWRCGKLALAGEAAKLRNSYEWNGFRDSL